MAKVALIGASGNVGARLLKELSDRGHAITAIARNPGKIAALPGVTAAKGDANDAASLAGIIAGHDAVISATRFVGTDFAALVTASAPCRCQTLAGRRRRREPRGRAGQASARPARVPRGL